MLSLDLGQTNLDWWMLFTDILPLVVFPDRRTPDSVSLHPRSPTL